MNVKSLAVAVFATAAIGLLAFPAGAATRRTVHVAGHQPVRVAAPRAGVSAYIIVEAGSGRVISLPGPVANVFVADPKVAEVRPASPSSLFLFGTAPGHTTVAALDASGHAVRQYEVTVKPSSFGATQAASAITRADPTAAVKLEAAPKRLVLNGHVATPAAANAAVAATTGFAADGQAVDNRLKVAGQIQVGLKLRIAEMSRNVTRDLGVNWQALGQVGSIGKLVALSGVSGLNSGTAATIACTSASLISSQACQGASFSATIDALATDNLIHMLAEPNLTAISGETASFLVGGEFPIPIAQGGTSSAISVEFKQFGIGLSFTPTVLSEERIRLHVRPEVSALSTVGAVTMNGITIPSLTVRRADTTIELGSGQSFAIAGLLSDQTNQTGNAIPELGEVPILGALFHSDAFQRQQTELVIIVTPYIVRPVSDPNALRVPTEGFTPPNDIERLLLMRQVGRTASATPVRVPGQAGFVIQ
jgi:pilus assembly protein CpaC